MRDDIGGINLTDYQLAVELRHVVNDRRLSRLHGKNRRSSMQADGLRT